VHHMGFTEIERAGKSRSTLSWANANGAKTQSYIADGQPEIVFLYKLLPSLSHRSFGTYVGRLAGLPQEVLERADRQSEWMREKVKTQWVGKLARRLEGKVFGGQSFDEDRWESRGQRVIEALREARGSGGQLYKHQGM
jgi:DNA mismatch repair ATPase MutS